MSTRRDAADAAHGLVPIDAGMLALIDLQDLRSFNVGEAA